MSEAQPGAGIESVERVKAIKDFLLQTPFGRKFPDLVGKVSDFKEIGDGFVHYKIMFQDGGEWEIGVPGDRSSQYGARPTLRMNGVDQPTAYPDAYALNDEIKGGELIKLLWDINKTGKEQNDSQAMHDRLGIK